MPMSKNQVAASVSPLRGSGSSSDEDKLIRSKTHVFWKNGALYAGGPAIDKAGIALSKQHNDVITDKMQRQREKRDGDSFHITVLTAEEKKLVMDGKQVREELRDVVETFWSKGARKSTLSARLLMDQRASSQFWRDLLQFPDDIFVAGVGEVSTKQSKAQFAVVNFPRAYALRDMLGFKEKEFHITLGFDHNDLHDVKSKGPTMLERVSAGFLSGLDVQSGDTIITSDEDEALALNASKNKSNGEREHSLTGGIKSDIKPTPFETLVELSLKRFVPQQQAESIAKWAETVLEVADRSYCL